MHTFTVARLTVVSGSTAWKCHSCAWCQSCIDPTDLPSKSQALFLLHKCATKMFTVTAWSQTYSINTLLKKKNSFSFAGSAFVKRLHQPTNYSVSLKVPQRNKTHSEAMDWLYQQHEMILCGGKNRPHFLVFINLNEDDTHHFLILPNLHSFFIILWQRFHNLCEQIHEHVVSNFLVSMCSVFLQQEILSWPHSLAIMVKLGACATNKGATGLY